jgi:hypothetical protein
MSARLKRTQRLPIMALAVGLLALTALSARAQVVDGRLDAMYGPPIVTQTTQTNYNDTTVPTAPGYANGSELDAAYGFIDGGVLHLLLAGNIGYEYPFEYSHEEQLAIFIDSVPGGQNVIRSDNANVPSGFWSPTGLTFDSDFEPDFMFLVIMSGWDLSLMTLPTSFGGTFTYVGRYSLDAPGAVTGGTNPFGITAALNDSNIAGVTHGCGAASGAGATTGFELAVPLQAIGGPTGCIKVTAMIVSSGGVSNQVLAPVPPGSCGWAAANQVNFAGIPGSQYFSVCSGATPTRNSTWGSLKAIYR